MSRPQNFTDYLFNYTSYFCLTSVNFLFDFNSNLSGHGESTTSLGTSKNLLLPLIQLYFSYLFYLYINSSHGFLFHVFLQNLEAIYSLVISSFEDLKCCNHISVFFC